MTIRILVSKAQFQLKFKAKKKLPPKQDFRVKKREKQRW
ncbi:hypothetical protein HID58_058632 [Brassica napus]|uniref:Uncharacterized protein n=1 Tax=Brassica napus TaxID=3708 RepID=A0ABQ7ZQP4_BRANA|nr:hypothetical protein HID58_058632 [Brassica napus]